MRERSKKRLTVTQVADEAGISRWVALRLIRTGQIPGGELLYTTERGRERWVLPRVALEEWLSSRPGA